MTTTPWRLPASTCADDIEDWDSLEQINLLTAIEKKFNIKFKLADVRGLKDVGDLLDLVARMVQNTLTFQRRAQREYCKAASWPPFSNRRRSLP